jgi:hypothetical protein
VQARNLTIKRLTRKAATTARGELLSVVTRALTSQASPADSTYQQTWMLLLNN